MSKEIGKDEIVDSLGRILSLSDINGKKRIAFYRALGNKDSANQLILAEYWCVMYVERIDGKLAGPIKSLVDIEYIYDQLEKGNAIQLVNEWIDKKEQAKAIEQKENKESGDKEIKK